MTVTRHDLARFQGLRNIIFNVIFSPTLSILLGETKNEVEAFLVGETMQRTSKTIHTGREGEVRV